MKEKLNPHDYFDIDPTPYLYKNGKGIIKRINDSYLPNFFQLNNEDVYSDETGSEIIKTGEFDKYFLLFWEKLENKIDQHVFAILNHHFKYSKNKDEFLSLLNYMINDISSIYAGYAGYNSVNYDLTGFKKVHHLINIWLDIEFDKRKKDKTLIWSGTTAQLKIFYKWLRNDEFSDCSEELLMRVMLGTYNNGETVNFTNLTISQAIYLLNKLSLVFNNIIKNQIRRPGKDSEKEPKEKPKDLEEVIKRKYIVEFFQINGEPIKHKQVSQTRNHIGKKTNNNNTKTLFEIENKAFVNKVNQLLSDLRKT